MNRKSLGRTALLAPIRQSPAVMGGYAMLVFCATCVAAGRQVGPHVAGGKDQSSATRETTAKEIPVRGVAHVGIQVSDLDKSRTFYRDVLGLDEVFDLPARDGQAAEVAMLKINDRQFIEIFPGLRPDQPAPIRYIGLYTDDAEKLHQMLADRGLGPGPLDKSRTGNLQFSIPNPPALELMSLDFVQYLPGSLHSGAEGKSLPDRRIGACVNHVGLVASDLNAGKKFCVEALGFREGNSKRRTNGTIYAVHLDFPGPDEEYFELSARPSRFDRHQGGIKTHLCLGVPDPAAAYQLAVARGAKLEPVQNRRGKQEKFPFLLFDPDHSRVEFKLAAKATE